MVREVVDPLVGLQLDPGIRREDLVGDSEEGAAEVSETAETSAACRVEGAGATGERTCRTVPTVAQ